MKKILVPTDFSVEAQEALDAAASLARKAGSEVLLLHVIEDPIVNQMKVIGEVGYDPSENVYVKLLIDKTKERLETIVGDSEYEDINISYKMEIGNPFTTIAESIAGHSCSLIVMGSRGASGIKELLIGSVADKTTRYAKCPVITIKAKTNLADVKHIVYATDLKNEQDQLISDLKTLQEFYGAFLHILKVYDSSWVKKEEVEERINEFADYHKLKNFTVNVEKANDEAEAILDFAKEIEADIIAIGAHDRHGLLHLIASHVSKNVVNHAHRAVWTKNIR